MPRVVLTTCNRWPELSESDRLYAAALSAHGVDVSSAPWNGPQAPFRVADAVVLRSNWDYHYTPVAFVAWVEDLDRRDVALFNPPPLLLWNVDKRYLFELAARGVTIPATHLIEGEVAPLLEALAGSGWERAVVKPAIGASGHEVRLLDLRTNAFGQVLLHEQRPLLVQEYLPEVEQSGELSCVFFAGAYSHSFSRRPQQGEFRVNSQYAGAVGRAEPPAAVVAQARAVLQTLPLAPLYARVDGVVRDGTFVLMELELNEPSLRLDLDPAAAERFAAATMQQLRALGAG